MNSTIAEVKSKIDILDYIGRYTTLKKAGKHYTGLCPFHKEKSPSFVVSPDRQMWYCFGACHEGGDVLNFLMKWENISFMEALRELAEEAGVALQDLKIDDQEYTRKDKIFKLNNLAVQFYQHILHKTPYGQKAREYLHARGLNEKIIETFQIGYAPASWDSLYKFLTKRSYSDLDIEQTGLFVQGKRGGYYDRFRGRLIFPIKEARGNTIGFSGRLLEQNDQQPKYINISETEVYHKRESLYGIHITKDAIREKKSVIVVEGEFDVITPYQHGIDNIVAIKGSSVTRDHLRILKRYAPRIILSLDADAAGDDAVIRAIREAEPLDLELFVLTVPEGKDPDEIVRTKPGAFKAALKHIVPAHDFVIDVVRGRYPELTSYAKKKIVAELSPFLSGLKNAVVREHYIRKLSETVESPPEAIKIEIENHVRGNVKIQMKKTAEESRKEDPLITGQKYIVSFVLQHKEPVAVAKEVFTLVTPEDFTVTALQKIVKAFISFHEGKEIYDEKEFSQHLAKELHPMYDEVSYTLLDPVSFQQPPIQLAYTVKERLLRKQRELAMQIADEELKEQRLQAISQERVRIQKYAPSRS